MAGDTALVGDVDVLDHEPPVPPGRVGQRIGPWRAAGWYLLLSFLSLLVLAPVYFLFVRAISDPSKAFTSSVLTPQGVRWDGFSEAWERGNLGGALFRSTVVTVLITGLQVTTSVLAAYAFAFLRFPLKRLVFAVFMATLLLPLEKLRDALLFLWTFWVLYRIARRLAHFAERWGQRQASTLESLFIPVLANGLQLILPLIALLLARPLLPTAPRYTVVVKLVVSMLLIITVAWVLIRALNVMDRLVAIRYPIHVADNLQARSIRTQFSFLRKLGIFLVMLIAGASILMLFDGARQLGTSLLTSAGILGLVVGFAAQKILGNLLAGFQIALTQPIRIDDAVIVENEWGWIEELTLTYVVVRLWDWRRLVLPINYFIEKPFQNWTRNSAELIGSVFLYTDYAVPLEPLRAELTRLLAAHPLWDGKVNVLQVTDSRERVIELRALMSARNAPQAWAHHLFAARASRSIAEVACRDRRRAASLSTSR